MHPVLVRHLIQPWHERLLGRKTFACLRELDRQQWWAPSELRRLQDIKLLALLLHAYDRTPFYRDRLDAAGVNLHGPIPDVRAVLAKLPLLDKTQIRSNQEQMIWRGAPGGLFPFSTGGSSGEPLTFYFDRRRQGYDQAARMRTHQWFGAKVGERELYLWGSPIEINRSSRVKTLRDRIFNQRLLNAFHMSATRLDAYLKEFDRFRPTSLFGYPSSIVRFVEHAASRGHRLNTKNLRSVFVTGEVCYPHDRETISAYFGVPVANCYGSREAGFIAHECPLGAMHTTDENLIVEVMQDGAPAPDGESGEIVVTHLDAYAMPFIRYRTGDVGRLLTGRCACGRGLGLMDVVSGRSTDFLYLPSGEVKHALSIIYPLRELSGVRQFRVVQHEDYAITVDVVRDAAAVCVTKEAIADRVRPVVGGDAPVTVRLVEEIPPADSGKHQYVISHAKESGVPVDNEAPRHD